MGAETSEMTIRATLEFRERFRRERIPGYYNGVVHALLTLLLLGGSIVHHALLLQAPTALEWLTVPAVLVLSNLVEYWLHRGPLHHPVPGLQRIFEIHTREHHRFFTTKRAGFDSPRDFYIVLFPAWAPALGAVAIFLAGQFGVARALSANTGHLFVLTATSYFLAYELLHLLHHLPDAHAPRQGILGRMREHHRRHHDPSSLDRYFNVTLPLGDWIFGTR